MRSTEKEYLKLRTIRTIKKKGTHSYKFTKMYVLICIIIQLRLKCLPKKVIPST